MSSPKCFIAVFGDPQQPGKSLLESGQYDNDPKYAPKTKSGDLMLLYCTRGYPGRPKQIAGIGVVLNTNSRCVQYRWLPFKSPIPKSRIDAGFEQIDRKRFGNIRMSSHWLFEISLKSFYGTVLNEEIDWPKV